MQKGGMPRDHVQFTPDCVHLIRPTIQLVRSAHPANVTDLDCRHPCMSAFLGNFATEKKLNYAQFFLKDCGVGLLFVHSTIAIYGYLNSLKCCIALYMHTLDEYNMRPSRNANPPSNREK